MSDLYNFNNNENGNYNNYNMNTGSNTPDNNMYNDNDKINKEKNTKNKRRAFTAKVLAAALVVGMGGGAVSYAGITYANSLYNAKLESESAAEDTNVGNITSLNASNTSADSGNTVSDVAESAIKSLVSISCTGEMATQSFFGGQQVYQYSSAGSGVIIDEDETNLYIVTNDHVISSAYEIQVQFADGSEHIAQVVGADSSNDIAVLSVPYSDISDETKAAISIATVGDSDALVLGEQVVAIGNALGYGQSVTSGYISAFDRSLTLSDNSGNTIESTGLIQTDASINSGDSGGGLFNMNGELIAINEAKSSTTSSGVTVDNMGYAIPMSKAMPIVESMIDGTFNGSSSTSNSAYLGVTVNEISDEVSMLYNMPDGLYITSISEGSPAQLAGLQTGDIISAIDGTSITTFDELSSYIAGKNAGDISTVTVYRTSNGVYSPMDVQVTFQANPNA
jgi:serine protease Do